MFLHNDWSTGIAPHKTCLRISKEWKTEVSSTKKMGMHSMTRTEMQSRRMLGRYGLLETGLNSRLSRCKDKLKHDDL